MARRASTRGMPMPGSYASPSASVRSKAACPPSCRASRGGAKTACPVDTDRARVQPLCTAASICPQPLGISLHARVHRPRVNVGAQRRTGMDPAAKSARLAILVAEDDSLLAADLEEAIRRCGYVCVGPAGGLSQVLRLIENDRVDAAILDVLLRYGEKIYPAADLLAPPGIPFAVVTPY